MVIRRILKEIRKPPAQSTRKLSLAKERKFKSCKRQVRKRNKKLPPNKRVNPFAVCRSALQI